MYNYVMFFKSERFIPIRLRSSLALSPLLAYASSVAVRGIRGSCLCVPAVTAQRLQRKLNVLLDVDLQTKALFSSYG